LSGILRGRLPVLPRMAGASAQQEIDETTGKGLWPRDDIANLQFELLVQCRRAGKVSAVNCRKPSNCNRGADGRATRPAKAGSLAERDRSHWSPLRCRRANCCPSHLNLTHDHDETGIQFRTSIVKINLKICPFWAPIWSR
jgi:hypothetical protein